MMSAIGAMQKRIPVENELRSDLIAVPVVSRVHMKCIAMLSRKIWPTYFSGIISAAQINYMLDKFYAPEAIKSEIQAGEEYFLLKVHARYVGFYSYVMKPELKEAQLSKMFLLESARQKGIATAVLASIERLCLSLKINRVWLAVNRNNKNAIAACKKLGFDISDKKIVDIGGGFAMDDSIMEKTL